MAYRLDIEPDPDLLITARMFAAAIADQSEFEAEVGDLKVAITEAVSAFLENGGEGGHIVIEADAGPDSVLFSVAGRGHVEVAPDTGSHPLVGLELVRALFPNLQVIGDPGGETRVSFQLVRRVAEA